MILEAVPEFRPVYEEHVNDFGEVLLHLLMSDLARFAVAAGRSGDLDRVDQVLAVLDQVFVRADESVDNAIAVSFVEHLGSENEPGEHEVLARFPEALTAELARQREWSAEHTAEANEVLKKWRESLLE